MPRFLQSQKSAELLSSIPFFSDSPKISRSATVRGNEKKSKSPPTEKKSKTSTWGPNPKRQFSLKIAKRLKKTHPPKQKHRPPDKPALSHQRRDDSESTSSSSPLSSGSLHFRGVLPNTSHAELAKTVPVQARVGQHPNVSQNSFELISDNEVFTVTPRASRAKIYETDQVYAPVSESSSNIVEKRPLTNRPGKRQGRDFAVMQFPNKSDHFISSVNASQSSLEFYSESNSAGTARRFPSSGRSFVQTPPRRGSLNKTHTRSRPTAGLHPRAAVADLFSQGPPHLKARSARPFVPTRTLATEPPQFESSGQSADRRLSDLLQNGPPDVHSRFRKAGQDFHLPHDLPSNAEIVSDSEAIGVKGLPLRFPASFGIPKRHEDTDGLDSSSSSTTLRNRDLLRSINVSYSGTPSDWTQDNTPDHPREAIKTVFPPWEPPLPVPLPLTREDFIKQEWAGIRQALQVDVDEMGPSPSKRMILPPDKTWRNASSNYFPPGAKGMSQKVVVSIVQGNKSKLGMQIISKRL